MLNWIFNRFSKPKENIFQLVDRLNARARGGAPKAEFGHLGTLFVPSLSLTLDDPMYLPQGLTIDNLASAKASFDAEIWRYPSGAITIKSLHIRFSEATEFQEHKEVGALSIDSATVVAADTEAIRDNWTETGLDRIGVISTVRNQELHRDLKKRFKLQTKQVFVTRAETVQPVSPELEAEITRYLESNPEYAESAYMYFHVQTNNSCDRAVMKEEVWANMPIGNQPEPLMFACSTGRGDGHYPTRASLIDSQVHSLDIPFITDQE